MTKMSAQVASAMCATSQRAMWPNISTATSWPESSPKVVGVTSSVACFVMIQETSAPSWRRKLTRSQTL